MKSLDDALHEAARDWTSQSTSTFADSSERLVRRLRLERNIDLGLSSFVGLALVGITWWCLGSTSVSSSPTNLTWSKNRSAPYQSLPSATKTEDMQSLVPKPRSAEHNDQSQHLTRAASDTAVKAIDERDASLRVEHNNDGFSDEYERILARAISSEQTNRVQSLHDYIGLAKLCERYGRYAHAANAWQQAASLAKQIGDERLVKSTDDALKAAQKRIVR